MIVQLSVIKDTVGPDYLEWFEDKIYSTTVSRYCYTNYYTKITRGSSLHFGCYLVGTRERR